MSPIGGVLDMTALARLHWHSLNPRQQAEAIHRQVACGHGDTPWLMPPA